jgi:pimeloyl-ACP methyl ester carboxylesterase
LPNDKKQAILFLHGWPGSFLNQSSSSSYDLIVASLPGYGYSDAPVRPGMHPGQMARIMHTLMQRLGYTTYVVCGGDWGASIGTFMAQLYPNDVRGLLVTLVIPVMTWQDTARLLLGHLFGQSLLLEQDELEYLHGRFNVLDHMNFLW